MGCCMSHFEKETVYEVTLDADGVAQRVPKGKGTHFIHISANNETHLEEKKDQQSATASAGYAAKGSIHPTKETETTNTTTDDVKEEEST